MPCGLQCPPASGPSRRQGSEDPGPREALCSPGLSWEHRDSASRAGVRGRPRLCSQGASTEDCPAVRGGGLEWPGAGRKALSPRPAGDSKPGPRRGCTPTGQKTGSSWGAGRCRPLAPGLALTPTHVAPPEDEHTPSLDLVHAGLAQQKRTGAQEILKSSATRKGPHQVPGVPRLARGRVSHPFTGRDTARQRRGGGHLGRTGGPCTQAERTHGGTRRGRRIGTTHCVFTGRRAGRGAEGHRASGGWLGPGHRLGGDCWLAGPDGAWGASAWCQRPGAPPLPLHRKNLSQLHRLEGSQGTREPGAPGKGRSASSVTSKAPAFGPGCSRAAWTAGLSNPAQQPSWLQPCPPTRWGQFLSAELWAQRWT